MAFYLKVFNKHSEYETYINGSDKILPNVSYCEDNDEVHFNPWSDPRVIAKYNVEDESEPVGLYGADYGAIASEMFSKIEIDGEEISISDLDDNNGYYTFDSIGEHTVKYTLLDPTTIGNNAFDSCSSLTSITIPNSVTSIGENAFGSCSSLTSINIPNSVTSIGIMAFYGCESLTSITIPSSVTSIGENGFDSCSSLTSVTFGNGLTHIAYGTFSSCSNLTSINIPNSVTSIDDSAFYGCESLRSITIPSSVTSIVDDAFFECMSLTSIIVESGNTVYDSRNNCNAIIETATNTLLYGCNNTIIPNSVTSIRNYAFYRCTSLTSINIPSSVASIGEAAFDGCSSLLSISIPSSVTNIGRSAFEWCSSLTSISVESSNTVYDSRNNCNAIIETATNTLLYGCNNTIIPNSVTSIGEAAFDGCSSLISISIPNSVTSIDDYAFSSCSVLTSITIPSSVTSIGRSAFYNCTSLETITSQATTAPTIQSNTFQNIKAGGTLYVPTGSNYSTWMGTGNYYLGKYGWTKVEQ